MLSNAEHEAITQGNKSRSLLILLPPELRNRIYEFACVATKARIRDSASPETIPRAAVASKLIQTCRQIRHGASDIVYGLCVFDISNVFKDSSHDTSQFLGMTLCTSIHIATIDTRDLVIFIRDVEDDRRHSTCKAERHSRYAPSLQHVYLKWFDELAARKFVKPAVRSSLEKNFLEAFAGPGLDK